ncbi:hypothetical protein AAFF_G00370650 [Aldrovandia affinis]|uniref:RING-type E3 ubiquitin transferase n=1 Tax=Aldrovandia affinis TaxID=143900 RepID=A0AAD7SGM8_9TELE|nr:hypothetical protein AAFF_G00370650 [Aldrovandia affinis]
MSTDPPKTEIIFCSPVHICNPGEIRQEYEKQKKMEEEKAKGEKATKQLIETFLENEQRQAENQKKKGPCHMPQESGLVAMNDKNKPHPHQRKEDWGTLKYIQDSLRRVLSDSENEEPIGKRTRHVSAFVLKTRSSSASSRIVQSHVGQRSRSCTDTEGRVKNNCPSHLAAIAKTCIAYTSNAGILLSSENSRSFSAPVLAPDKRAGRGGGGGGPAATSPFMVPHPKPERSISPESNDSISEELNHFKPIVCSPCTPPKRLPDGRVVEPVFVKSTPRNLSRRLQKATSYEASPAILRKWRQIETDRRHSKMTSKGTVTSPVAEDFTPHQSPSKNIRFCAPEKNALRDRLGASVTRADASRRGKGKPLAGNKWRLIFDTSVAEQNISSGQSSNACVPTEAHSTTQGACEAVQRTRARCTPSSQARQRLHTREKCARVTNCNRIPIDSQDQTNNPNVRNRVTSRPTSRRGRKRSQKTKHLEEAGRLKRLRPQSRVEFDGERDTGVSHTQRTRQEHEDQKVALKLQRQFRMESRAVDRQKTCPDKCLLRSWASSGTTLEHSLRRPAILGEVIKYFSRGRGEGGGISER